MWRAHFARGRSTPVKRHMTTSTVASPVRTGEDVQSNHSMMWALRRNLGSAIARANVRFLHDRLCFAVGGSAQPEAAFERRRKARARFFEDGDPASAAWARRQQRFQRAPPQFGTAGASTG